MNMKKLLAASLAAVMLVSSLGACGSAAPAAEAPAESEAVVSEVSEATEASEAVEEVTEATEAEPVAEADGDLEIRMAVLSGSTGYGAAKLMDKAEAGETELNYAISVESSPKVIMDALIAGELDLAALPTNKAALIAEKTQGKIQVVAVNTLGVMYLVTTDDSHFDDFSELSGKTVAIPEEPSYILTALLEANNVTDVNVETYATPADLVQAVMKGDVTIAVLPEPLLSTAMSKKDSITISLNLTEEWAKVYSDSTLMQGCVVVNTEFAAAHPAEMDQFIYDLDQSITYVSENAEDSAELIEKYFETPAVVAVSAIARANLACITGNDMKQQLSGFYEVLSTIPAAGIGEAVPSEEFYYISK